MGPLGKCAPCLDEAIAGTRNGAEVITAKIADAVVSVTVIQQFNVPGGQTMAVPSQIAVCLRHRQGQLGTVPKSGLLLG